MEIEKFSARLKQLREKMGLNQTDFAKLIEVKQQTLSGYERGVMKPPLDVAKNIASTCDISLDWLCGLTDKMSYRDELATYADLIRVLLEIEKKLDLSIHYQYNGYDEAYDIADVTAEISFLNEDAQLFIKDWQKMKELHDNLIIDDDVYKLWIEKEISKYSYIPLVGKGCDEGKT